VATTSKPISLLCSSRVNNNSIHIPGGLQRIQTVDGYAFPLTIQDASAVTWQAQMNCHDDALATDYLDNWAEPSKDAPFIPASKVSVEIEGVTITHNIACRLRQAASSPAIEQHLKTTNDWTISTLEYHPELFAISC
jgi:hypothetical protein